MNVSNLWLILAGFHIILAIVKWSSDAIDVQFHDTYFVFSALHFWGLIALFYLGLYGLYHILARYQILPAVFLQVLQALSFMYVNFRILNAVFASTQSRYYSFYQLTSIDYSTQFYIFMFFQFLFLLDILRKVLAR